MFSDEQVTAKLYGNDKFQENFIKVQSESIKAVRADSSDAEASIARNIRKNLEIHGQQISQNDLLIQGKPYEQTTDILKMKVNSYSKA